MGVTTKMGKLCPSCRRTRHRYRDFSPRWEHLPKSAIRQPRCKQCDRRRGRRRGKLATLKRMAERDGGSASNVQAADPDVTTIDINDEVLKDVGKYVEKAGKIDINLLSTTAEKLEAYSKKWHRLMWGYALRFSRPPRLTADDLYSVALECLWNIIKNWDEDAIDTPHFWTYFEKSIKSRLLTAVRDQERACRDYRVELHPSWMKAEPDDEEQQEPWGHLQGSFVGVKMPSDPSRVFDFPEFKQRLREALDEESWLVLLELVTPSEATLKAQMVQKATKDVSNGITLKAIAKGLTVMTGERWTYGRVRRIRVNKIIPAVQEVLENF